MQNVYELQQLHSAQNSPLVNCTLYHQITNSCVNSIHFSLLAYAMHPVVHNAKEKCGACASASSIN